jgi:hypothetical protein
MHSIIFVFAALIQIAFTALHCAPNCLSPHTCCSHFGSKVECDKATTVFPLQQSHGHLHCKVEKITKIAFNNCPPHLQFNRSAFNLLFNTEHRHRLLISFENVNGCTANCLDYTTWTGLRLSNGRVCKGLLFTLGEGRGREINCFLLPLAFTGRRNRLLTSLLDTAE